MRKTVGSGRLVAVLPIHLARRRTLYIPHVHKNAFDHLQDHSLAIAPDCEENNPHKYV